MTRSPRPRLRLARRALLVLGAVLITALWVVRTDVFSRQVARLLEQVIATQTGERVLIGGVRIEPLRRRASIEGLVLSHISANPAHDGRTIAAVERITAVLGLEGWAPRLRLLEIERPVVRLHLDADGLREFRGLARAPGDLSAPAATRFPWDELRLFGANFVIEGQGFTVEVEGADALPQGDAVALDIARLAFRTGDFRQAAYGIHLGGVVAAPDRVRVPDIEIQLRPEAAEEPDSLSPLAPPSLVLTGDASLQPDGQLGGTLYGDLRVDALSPLTRDVAYEGRAQLDVTLGGTLEELHLAGSLAVDGLKVHETYASGRIGTYAPGNFTAAWRLDGPIVTLESLEDRLDGGVLEVSGTLDLRTQGIMASVSGERLGLASVLRAVHVHPAAWVDFQADLEAQIAGTLKPFDIAGSFEVALIDLFVGDGPAGQAGTDAILAIDVVSLEGELRLKPENIRLRAARIRSGASGGTAEATIGLGHDGPLDVRAVLDPLDLALAAPLGDVGLAGVGRVEATIAGPFSDIDIRATAAVDDFVVLDIPFADQLVAEIVCDDLVHLELPRFQAVKGQTAYTGGLTLAFENPFWLDLQILVSQGGQLHDIVGMFLEVPGLEGTVEGMLTLEGDPDALNGEADLTLTDVNLFGERFDGGFARGWMDEGVFTLDDLVLTRFQGGESLLARGTVGAGWASHFDIVSGGVRLERLDLVPDSVPVRGGLVLDATVGGTLFEPAPRGRLAVRDTWLYGEPVADSTIDFQTDAGVLRYKGNLAGEGLALQGELGLWGQQPYNLHADLVSFPVHVVYPQGADGGPVDARLTGAVDLSGAFGDTPTPIAIDATFDTVSASWGSHRLTSPGPWRYSQLGTTFKADGIELQGAETRLSFGGWRAADGRMAFSGGGSMELDLLRAFVPDLQKAEGIADVQLSMFTLGKEPIRPVLDVELRDATIRTAYFPHPFEALEASLTLAPDGYDINDLRARLGGGSVVGGGRIDADGWSPVRYDLHLEATDARVRYLDYLPAMVADASLSFDGPADELLMSGQIEVDSMIFADRIDWESWVLELSEERLTGTAAEATEDIFSFDIGIRADDTIRMRNNVGDLGASADLRIVGDTSRVGLVGEVRIAPGGSVYFQEREFELERGELRFVDPYTFDPELEFNVATDVTSREQEYHIDMRVDGLYSDWRTIGISDPPLSQSDINALLVFGMTREELERYGGLPTALALEGTDLLAARFGLVERVGEGLFQIDLLRLDRVELVSGVSERGAGTVSSEVRLLAEKEIGWDTRVLLEQNLSRTSDTYIGLEKRLARTLYARSYWASMEYGRSLNIGGAYGVDFKLRWELD